MTATTAPWKTVFALLLFSFWLICPRWAAACDQVPAGQTFRIRLLQPIASYSAKKYNRVVGILTESPQCDGQPIFPIGTGIEGQIKEVHKVGFGFHHETAELKIEFERITPNGAPPVDISARVVEVDNARERVGDDGTIHGIRSTDTFQDHVSLRLLQIPAWDPDTFWILSARKAAFPVSPEPEIFFPRGTDMSLELAASFQLADEIEPAPANREFEDWEQDVLNDKVLSLPERATTQKGRSGDIVNLAFIGSSQQLQTAFHAAGWVGSDVVSTKSVFRSLRAVFSLNSYSRLPISKELLDGKTSDASWQKSLDSFSKRDHLRIWSRTETWAGQPIWLSGSIHERGAGLSPRKRRFVHYLDSNLDEEREKVLRDLTVAGCVDAVHIAPRPTAPHYLRSPTGDNLRTDGAIAVIRLKDCNGPVFAKSSAGDSGVVYRPTTKFKRYLRTQVLTFRSDLWRSNAPYTAFELVHGAVGVIHRRHARELALKQQLPPQPENPKPIVQSTLLPSR